MTPTPARPALDAMAEESIYTKRTITHDEAVEIAHRLINSHFNKEPCARASIPARPDYDDDLLILAFIEQQRRSLADMRGALEKIESMQPVAFSFPADWSAQIAGCSECQRYKKHPIQQGICDTHRKPLYERERHEQHERETMRFRMKDVAREALARSAPCGK